MPAMMVCSLLSVDTKPSINVNVNGAWPLALELCSFTEWYILSSDSDCLICLCQFNGRHMLPFQLPQQML